MVRRFRYIHQMSAVCGDAAGHAHGDSRPPIGQPLRRDDLGGRAGAIPDGARYQQDGWQQVLHRSAPYSHGGHRNGIRLQVAARK